MAKIPTMSGIQFPEKALAYEPITDRIQFFAEVEAQLITTEDTLFRFHSGIPG